ncbi:MAG: HdeD family acid-resistance protein [Culicoidibacterales bacterium]
MKARITALILNILLGLIGFILILNPQTGVDFARYYIGGILIVTSIVPFWSFYQTKDAKKDWKRLAQGIFLAVLGLVFLISVSFSAVVFASLLLFWMVSSGIMKIIIAFEYRKVFKENWWYMLIFGTISLLFAMYMVFNLQQTLLFFVSVSGLFMLVEASMGIVDMLLSHKK